MIGELQHREFILNWVLSILRILVRKKKKTYKVPFAYQPPFLISLLAREQIATNQSNESNRSAKCSKSF